MIVPTLGRKKARVVLAASGLFAAAVLVAGVYFATERLVGRKAEAATPAKVVSAELLAPPQVPAPIARKNAATVLVDLETTEVATELAPGVQCKFWTFNGTVPGPVIRAHVGDTLEFHLKGDSDNVFPHSIDLHAVTGPGGGAVLTQTPPGQQTSFRFKALNPGVYVYHCATPPVVHHLANGMYGLIIVEPKGGLPKVDREYYVMQQEVYTEGGFGEKGLQNFSDEKALREEPDYLVFNGATNALIGGNALRAKVGEMVRIWFGVGGPNVTSSFHVIGEIFDKVYREGSLTSSPITDVQTTLVPTGGATMVEFKVDVPGTYLLVDHSLTRLQKEILWEPANTKRCPKPVTGRPFWCGTIG